MTLRRATAQTRAPGPGTGAVAAPESLGRRAKTPRWILLVHQLPARPSNLRVRTWRRLQQLGAIAVKQALYVLPDSPEAREDFQWLKTEIEAAGGQATLFAADTIEPWSSDELVEEFRRAREKDYATVSRTLERSLAATRRKRAPRRSRQAALRIVETFRQRLAAVEAIDFFTSAGRDRAATLIGELQKALGTDTGADATSSRRNADAYVGRTWVTRPRPGIDRMGSAWLIKRFIDPEGRFGFVDQPPASGNAIPFDMFGVEFTHQGEWCTFETLVHRFAVADAAVSRLAGIVHDLDLKDAKFGAPEAAAVGAMADGLQTLYPDDHVLLDQGMTMFEALYRSFERAARPAGPRPLARRRRSPSARATRK
jgi:hypothetical protein